MSDTASPLDRRSFLRMVGVGGAAVVLSAGSSAAWAAEPRDKALRVYTIVVDGCKPDEITPELMPHLHQLRTVGVSYPRARSLPVMETIPNHVMMMSGVRPDRSGVPANSVYDRAAGLIRDLDRPTDLRFSTLLDRLRERGKVTGSVLSKEYLYGIFGERATVRWEPEPLIPGSDHAPDAATADALKSMVDSADPDFVFANFGDVDRMGHADASGTTVEAARTAALAATDSQIGGFVDHLVATGRWSSSILLFLADHSMDWSMPDRMVSLHPAMEADPMLAGRTTTAQNGGADLLYYTGPATERDAAVRRMRDVASAVEGVLSVHTPAELRLGPEAGDLVAYCEPGWRFTDPSAISNPIPGNHGHPATEPIPFFATGGHPAVRSGITSSEPARTVDVAPTVGSLFRLPAPRGGYDGRPRTEGFDPSKL